MWILITIHASLRWAKIDNIYIRHGETQEARLKSSLFSRFEEFFLQYVADTAVTFISLLLADITMVNTFTLRFLFFSQDFYRFGDAWSCTAGGGASS